MFAVVLGVNAQRRMQVWEGNTYMQFFTTEVDSVTFLSFPEGILQECEEIHDTIIKTITVHDTVTLTVRDTITKTVTVRDTITQIVKDTVYIQYCPDTVSDKPLSGAFSVSATKQVRFSRGNLQYTQSTQTWSFAEHQYDMLGTDNVDGGTVQINSDYGYYYKDGNTLADKIDLFGWSGSTGSAKWGIGTSTEKTDYSGDFVDWGKNTIGTDIPDTWRTLTKDEWGYLLSGRTNAYNLAGVARINLNADGSKYVNGLVLLPDNWTCPAGVTFKSGLAGTYSVQAYADYQTFTFSDWQLLESAGAVFLPASGSRYGASVFSVQYYGFYWSATPAASDEAYYMSFSSYSCFSKYGKGSLYGYAVRLVKNYSNVSTDLSHPSAADTAPARKVLRNGTVLIERNGKMYTLTGTEVK